MPSLSNPVLEDWIQHAAELLDLLTYDTCAYVHERRRFCRGRRRSAQIGGLMTTVYPALHRF